VKTQELSREELYAIVWQEPMRTLAKRFSVSDVAMAKWCKKLHIPVPGRGYWAKKAAGHKVRQTPLRPLPATAERSTATITPTPPAVAAPRSDEPESVRGQREYEARTENLISVAGDLRSSHALVRQTTASIRAAHAPSDPYSTYKREPRLDIDVSDALFNRALRVCNAILKGLDARGFTPSLGKGDDRETHAVVLGQRLAFGVREGTKRRENPPPQKQRVNGQWIIPYYQRYTFEPSGELTLFVRNWGGHGHFRTWKDGKHRRIEEYLNEFMVALVERAEDQRALEARWERDRQERAVAEQRRYEEQQRREREVERVRELETQAKNWAKSRDLNAYLAAVRDMAQVRHGGIQPGSELGTWLEWATRYAASLDPLRPPDGDETGPTQGVT
jgi:hypothetical protein